ncbi:hypothetical protein TTHERM_00294590 (macronuclear) [Tetrahymena thermophila SB210]|uniref:Uncharacterized protein n=1 Tax=Tetrahymena thermophila (strain SB210) TaxID=312017 RepID=I7MDW4_TETTS|nr:hypothetical protein TTHERM_00294590 [Tetrahymena thermophila SB210]EAR92846.2 hypothetical protein TTHERM_00294590 [Tetrahymena thermophila SB210]|eukprot:XP_001013091.2 hypothetical protein TTHERM_00294590 [Tetrahymena thermophila SB210]
MNSTLTIKNNQSHIYQTKTQKAFSTSSSVFFDKRSLVKSLNQYQNILPLHHESPVNSIMIDQTQQNFQKLQNKQLSQIHPLLSSLNSPQNQINQGLFSAPISPKKQKERIDFQTYAQVKQIQQQMLQKSQSLTSSPSSQSARNYNLKKSSLFAPQISIQQSKLEKIIQKGEKSLNHFQNKNKQALFEKNIAIPNVLSEPTKINYLFNDIHIMNKQKEADDLYYGDRFDSQQQQQSPKVQFIRQSTSQSQKRKEGFMNSPSLPNLIESLVQFQSSITPKKKEVETSAIKRIFEKKEKKSPSITAIQYLESPKQNEQSSPQKQMSNINNNNLVVKINQQNLQKSQNNSFGETGQKQVIIDINNQVNQDEKSYFNKKKISWSDQLYINTKKNTFNQNQTKQENIDVEQFSPITQNIQTPLNQSPLLNRQTKSLINFEKISPIKQNEGSNHNTANHKQHLFKEQVKLQMSQIEVDPRDTEIDRNFKRFKIIEDLQKIRIQEKINQFKIGDNIDKKQILKKNASKVLIQTQTELPPCIFNTKCNSSLTLINNLQSNINCNPHTQQRQQKEKEQNELTQEEDIEQCNQADQTQNNLSKNQIQAPPSLINIESGIIQNTVNESEVTPSIESIEKNTFGSYIKSNMNINLQGLSQQNIEDDVDTPLMLQSHSSSLLQKNHNNSVDHKQINGNNAPDLEPKMMLRKQVTLKLKTIQNQDLGDSQNNFESLIKGHLSDNSFSTNSPRSPYLRKQYKQSIRKSAFTSNLNTPKSSARRNTKLLTINPKLNSNEQINFLDAIFNEDDIKILHELSFYISDLMKALKQDISLQLKNDIYYFCTPDFDQFIFSISQFIQYICTQTQQDRNNHYICPFKLNDSIVEQLLYLFINKLSEINLGEKYIDIFRNAFNKHKQLVLASNLSQKLGGEMQKKRIITEVIDYQMQNSVNSIYERYQKDDLIQSQLKTFDLILKSSCEEVSEQDWKDVKYYNAVDIFESKKAFINVLSRHKNFYDEEFCYELIEQIERCRDNISHSLSIHRFGNDQKFIKSLKEFIVKIQFIQKLGNFEKETIINTIINYFFSPNVTSQQFISVFKQHQLQLNKSQFSEIQELLINHLRVEQEYNENLDYKHQFQYKIQKINWQIQKSPLNTLGDLTSFFQFFNSWIDQQISQKRNLKGFEPYEVRSTENFECILKFYYNTHEVFNVKDIQFSLNLPIFETETLIKFWLKGIKHTLIQHCGLQKSEAIIFRDEISKLMLNQGNQQIIKRLNTQNSFKNAISNISN